MAKDRQNAHTKEKFQLQDKNILTTICKEREFSIDINTRASREQVD